MEVFSGTKLSFNDVQVAINQIGNGETGSFNTPARTSFILCPITSELWDLKPIVGKAFENVGRDPKEVSWVTTSFQPQLSRLGFTLVKFAPGTKPILGLNGFDLKSFELNHEVLFPPDQRVEKNGFAKKSFEQDHTDPKRRPSTVNPFARNSAFAREVRLASDGYCDACGERTFKISGTEIWFVEVHHKRWLREGGHDKVENMVALCPTCHRSEHHSGIRKYK